jgi:hypothetical protein
VLGVADIAIEVELLDPRATLVIGVLKLAIEDESAITLELKRLVEPTTEEVLDKNWLDCELLLIIVLCEIPTELDPSPEDGSALVLLKL